MRNKGRRIEFSSALFYWEKVGIIKVEINSVLVVGVWC